MSVRLSCSIMAHPQRSENVKTLLNMLTDEPGLIPVSWDNEGPASGDHDRVWRNTRAAWEMHDPSADWHLVLQDDALTATDLLAGLATALEHGPGAAGVRSVVSLYLGQGRHVSNRWNRMTERADEAGAAWVRTASLGWGVAIALPTSAIGDMIAFADRRQGIPDDMRIAGWAKRTKLDVWYTWPSLVDHLPIPSLTKHNATDRRARRFLTGSASDVDWAGTVITDPMLIRTRGERSGPRQRHRPAQTVVPGR